MYDEAKAVESEGGAAVPAGQTKRTFLQGLQKAVDYRGKLGDPDVDATFLERLRVARNRLPLNPDDPRVARLAEMERQHGQQGFELPEVGEVERTAQMAKRRLFDENAGGIEGFLGRHTDETNEFGDAVPVEQLKREEEERWKAKRSAERRY